MNVYVAGSSRELERATRAMDAVREIPGLTLVHDWVEQIRAYNGNANRGLTDPQRATVAAEALEAVRRAGCLWLLLPEEPTVGAWVELGHFLGTCSQLAGARIIVSGNDPERTIFTALADSIAPTDEAAVRFLQKLGRAHD